MMALPRGWVVWAAAGLAAVSIGLAAGPLPWRFAGESGLPQPRRPAPEETPDAAFSVEPILALSPFGRLVGEVSDAPAAETSLGLTLHGVVIATRPEASSAIVSGQSEPARSYAVGQEIVPDATLAEVHGDHVVLLVDGRQETLSFPQARVEPDPGLAALRALVTAQPEAPVEEPAAGDAEAVLADFRERINDDPQALLDELGLTATEAGYQVGENASEGVLWVGLQPGDLVARVNGQQVGNIEQDRSLFDDLTAAGRVRMEVERNGQVLVLTIPLQ